MKEECPMICPLSKFDFTLTYHMVEQNEENYGEA